MKLEHVWKHVKQRYKVGYVVLLVFFLLLYSFSVIFLMELSADTTISLNDSTAYLNVASYIYYDELTGKTCVLLLQSYVISYNQRVITIVDKEVNNTFQIGSYIKHLDNELPNQPELVGVGNGFVFNVYTYTSGTTVYLRSYQVNLKTETHSELFAYTIDMSADATEENPKPHATTFVVLQPNDNSDDLEMYVAFDAWIRKSPGSLLKREIIKVNLAYDHENDVYTSTMTIIKEEDLYLQDSEFIAGGEELVVIPAEYLNLDRDVVYLFSTGAESNLYVEVISEGTQKYKLTSDESNANEGLTNVTPLEFQGNISLVTSNNQTVTPDMWLLTMNINNSPLDPTQWTYYDEIYMDNVYGKTGQAYRGLFHTYMGYIDENGFSKILEFVGGNVNQREIVSTALYDYHTIPSAGEFDYDLTSNDDPSTAGVAYYIGDNSNSGYIGFDEGYIPGFIPGSSGGSRSGGGSGSSSETTTTVLSQEYEAQDLEGFDDTMNDFFHLNTDWIGMTLQVIGVVLVVPYAVVLIKKVLLGFRGLK